jgi:hypothetical protein
MAQEALARWHRIVRTRDAAALDSVLAETVVFHSPVMHTPQHGKAVTTRYLAAALAVFLNDSFRYEREFVGENGAVLEFTVDIDGIEINGVDMLSWNGEGLITGFKVMLRPLQAVHLIHERMRALLAASP